MIYQNDKNENTQNQFSNALKELQIGKLLRNANITKSCGVSAYEVFQFLLLLVFQGRNLFRFLNSKHKGQAVSKNTYYRFLSETSYNWSRFLLLLAANWDGLRVTVLSLLGSICFLLQKRPIVTMKYLKTSIIVQTVISSAKKA